MATRTYTGVHTQLETLFHDGSLGGLTDSELLARFLTGDAPSAEAAFATLVERHGPMVMRICRSALGTTHDAEDAAQAVFLVLARRAGSVRRRDSAASWLYGVARRVAARAWRDDARRRKHERRRAEMAVIHTRVAGRLRHLRGSLQGDRRFARDLSVRPRPVLPRRPVARAGRAVAPLPAAHIPEPAPPCEGTTSRAAGPARSRLARGPCPHLRTRRPRRPRG